MNTKEFNALLHLLIILFPAHVNCLQSLKVSYLNINTNCNVSMKHYGNQFKKKNTDLSFGHFSECLLLSNTDCQIWRLNGSKWLLFISKCSCVWLCSQSNADWDQILTRGYAKNMMSSLSLRLLERTLSSVQIWIQLQ